ncbi:MAG: efflux RND transporter periplasmic adaptor subunit [Paludibacter sp.]|nr:efflux RND transporter periplasmic adaptor subunit [Bacteroidales bacterium]MCM1069240.1 efflux RND transporter periplasmic adaptor subunit [Prevotella sp.]MCM1354340.1 efflux RND transporter periplasmic adaptor subunit [Bacteroides sp.]MCM1443200.1 efflux RND transporter periplasmic adaptor subunit [Muribaculum sp.]MCM1481795.1 efflux RND transporter periplasmic adaptor subunit [Paludibacter sp.]
MDSKNKTHNLLIGLIALVAVIVIVGVIGILALRPESIVITGEAEATEYRVSGKVPGRIEMFFAEEGDHVQKGDTLVFIDSPEVRAKLAQARAARAAAAAQDQKAQNGAQAEQIQGAYELYQKALVGEDIMRKSYNRVKNLYEKGVVSAQKKDEVEAQYKAAVATTKAAKSQYEMAKKGARSEDKAAAAAVVARADGAISEVEAYLDELYLTAPAGGEITTRFPKVGELVGSGSPIMSITDLSDMWLTFSIREDLLPNMTVGSTINFTVPALGESTYQATITYMQAKASYATWRATKASGQFDAKTFEVKARPNSTVPNLRPGMTVVMQSAPLN